MIISVGSKDFESVYGAWEPAGGSGCYGYYLNPKEIELLKELGYTVRFIDILGNKTLYKVYSPEKKFVEADRMEEIFYNALDFRFF